MSFSCMRIEFIGASSKRYVKITGKECWERMMEKDMDSKLAWLSFFNFHLRLAMAFGRGYCRALTSTNW
jgi:hypothetical protein